MAEYWKSTPKYWCKHCATYVRDTPFERTQHEATGKHQGALKRFLRDIHRGKEQEERESHRAKNEIQRLKGLVAGSPGPEGQRQPPWKRPGGDANTGGASTSRSATAEARKRQMAQLVEMGVAIPEEFRAEMALAGEWQEVAQEKSSKVKKTADTPAAAAFGVRKRKLYGPGDEEAEETAPRKAWGSAFRRYTGASGDDEDLDALLETTTDLKGKKAVKTEPKAENEHVAKLEDEQTPVKKEEAEEQLEAAPESKDETVKKEADDLKPEEGTDEPNLAAIPEAIDAPAVVFKKRKPKQMKR